MPPCARSGPPLAPPPPSGAARLIAVLVVLAALAGAVWWLWLRPAQAPAPQADVPAPAAAPAEPVASAPAEPALHHPVDALGEADAQLPPLAQSDDAVRQALEGLLGAQQAATWLQLDGFVHRAVATVDNLARPQASVRLWPVQPTAGRFAVDGPPDAQTQTIAADNAGRYRAFVALAESVPQDAAVKLYARLYPLLQSAYEELGYPGRYFNDRLVAVLDHLLATPEPGQPLAVQLTRVEGEVASTRPWVRYEFADPKLQALSSGQKMLLRMGPDNARRLKAVMTTLRARVATGVRPAN
ncbi:DUF3014 domain-containing protein [Pulveribacter sp.]|uniref:DUF3014 domain-containing protein n=1 Tax=Pulveribacter sp. TaxID=2678893 RepID=UPI0028AA0C40|nr:DUF3014 domain-containing protein [Pulveribacter sp.]